MENEFVPYQQSLELKELGFDEHCLAKYSIDIIGETIPHFRYNNRISQAESIDEGVWFNHNLDKEYIWSAPLYQQAFKWFREKFDLRIWIESNYGVAKFEYVIATTNPNFINKQFNDFSGYKTYEEAEQACLKKLIQIVKENKQ
jgi:hypothetical protein